MSQFNHYDLMNAFDNGQLNENQMVKWFQHLIHLDAVWHMPDRFQVKAWELLNNGLCTLD